MRQDRPKERVPTKIGSSTNLSKSAKDLRGEEVETICLNAMLAEIKMPAKEGFWSYRWFFWVCLHQLWIELQCCQRLVLFLAISPNETLLHVFGMSSIYVGRSVLL